MAAKSTLLATGMLRPGRAQHDNHVVALERSEGSPARCHSECQRRVPPWHLGFFAPTVLRMTTNKKADSCPAHGRPCPVLGRLCPTPGRPEVARCGYLRVPPMRNTTRCRPVRVSTRSVPTERFEMLPCAGICAPCACRLLRE